MKEATFERVRRIAADVLQVSPERISVCSAMADFENWDSLQHLSLVLALEQAFDVMFEPEDLEQMTSVGHIVELLERKSA